MVEIFTQFRALNQSELISVKRAELERQLSSINASLASSATASDESEKTRTICLNGLHYYTSSEDIEDALAAHGLRAEVNAFRNYTVPLRELIYNGQKESAADETTDQ